MKKYFVANFKMELSLKDSLALLKKYNNHSFDKQKTIIICPDFLAIASFKKTKENIQIGSQNCAHLRQGALTGEISPLELKKLGVSYVIIGHSERRFLKEDNALIAKKVKQALANNLKVILCLGETKEDKRKKITKQVIKGQLLKAVKDLNKTELENIIIAYEPRWAIGQRQACLASQATIVHQYIKDLVKKRYKHNISVIYGGSLNENNLVDFNLADEIDGFLIGRASLNFNQFKKMVNLC